MAVIKVDENDPVGELEPSFPFRDVKILHNVDVRDYYDLKEEIGRGKFGTVYRCVEKKTGTVLAAKFVPIAKKQDRINVEREVEIMKTLQHPRLIQLYDSFEIHNVMCVVLELIEGGELFERVIDDDFILTEKACSVFMRQICEGVSFIHANQVIHLDLKPENILCLTKTGNRIKIIDFGLARKYDPNKKLQVLFGTPEFVAPEVVNFDEITVATDMWSVGVICYVLLSGLSPFMGENDVQTMTNVTMAQYDFDDEAFDTISADAKDFISNLLVKNKEKRMKADECLNHSWLKRKPPPPNTYLEESKENLKTYVDTTHSSSPFLLSESFSNGSIGSIDLIPAVSELPKPKAGSPDKTLELFELAPEEPIAVEEQAAIIKDDQTLQIKNEINIEKSINPEIIIEAEPADADTPLPSTLTFPDFKFENKERLPRKLIKTDSFKGLPRKFSITLSGGSRELPRRSSLTRADKAKNEIKRESFVTFIGPREIKPIDPLSPEIRMAVEELTSFIKLNMEESTSLKSANKMHTKESCSSETGKKVESRIDNSIEQLGSQNQSTIGSFKITSNTKKNCKKETFEETSNNSTLQIVSLPSENIPSNEEAKDQNCKIVANQQLGSTSEKLLSKEKVQEKKSTIFTSKYVQPIPSENSSKENTVDKSNSTVANQKSEVTPMENVPTVKTKETSTVIFTNQPVAQKECEKLSFTKNTKEKDSNILTHHQDEPKPVANSPSNEISKKLVPITYSNQVVATQSKNTTFNEKSKNLDLATSSIQQTVTTSESISTSKSQERVKKKNDTPTLLRPADYIKTVNLDKGSSQQTYKSLESKILETVNMVDKKIKDLWDKKTKEDSITSSIKTKDKLNSSFSTSVEIKESSQSMVRNQSFTESIFKRQTSKSGLFKANSVETDGQSKNTKSTEIGSTASWVPSSSIRHDLTFPRTRTFGLLNPEPLLPSKDAASSSSDVNRTRASSLDPSSSRSSSVTTHDQPFHSRFFKHSQLNSVRCSSEAPVSKYEEFKSKYTNYKDLASDTDKLFKKNLTEITPPGKGDKQNVNQSSTGRPESAENIPISLSTGKSPSTLPSPSSSKSTFFTRQKFKLTEQQRDSYNKFDSLNRLSKTAYSNIAGIKESLSLKQSHISQINPKIEAKPKTTSREKNASSSQKSNE